MPAASISSVRAGRRSAALAALASFVSLTSMSPRTMAVMSRPSRSTKKVAFAVSSALTPRNAARSAIVAAPGVATSSSGRAVSVGGSDPRTVATWRLAEKPHVSHRTSTSSPYSLRTMNSWACEPPIMPTSDATAMALSPSRSKIREYAS